MQKDASLALTKGPPKGKANKYNASYGAMKKTRIRPPLLLLLHNVCVCAMMSDCYILCKNISIH